MRGSFRRRNQTEYIIIDTSLCELCEECINGCPQKVLSKIDFLGHRHARIRHAELCKGCNKCVRLCKIGAIKSKTVKRQPA